MFLAYDPHLSLSAILQTSFFVISKLANKLREFEFLTHGIFKIKKCYMSFLTHKYITKSPSILV